MLVFNIDDPKSVEKSIHHITEDWFDPNMIYINLKSRSTTDTSAFWFETKYLLENISLALSMPYEDFNREFGDRCQKLDLRIMAYHCTRARHTQVFLKSGILPLTEKVLWDFLSESTAAFSNLLLSKDDKNAIVWRIMQTEAWNYRATTGAGPYFFLSYQAARDEGNDFLKSGSEIWWICVDNLSQYCYENDIELPTTNRVEWREKIGQNKNAVIVHCLMPYSLLPNNPYYVFCMLRSFFNNFDPEDDLSETVSIDLRGKALGLQYIAEIEQM